MDHSVIFVSGGSGFIGTWVVLEALKTGAKVKTSVRDKNNEKKVQHLFSLPGAKERLTLVELDLEKSTDSEFLLAIQDCTHILHTASPFYLHAKTEEELTKPAVLGTLGILRAAAATKTVKSVVITSSVAAIQNNSSGNPPDYVYGEKDWNDPNVAYPYPKSKTLAEMAAWEFWKNLPEESRFSLCTINPSYVNGPCIAKELQTSAEVVKNILGGLPLIPDSSFGVVDVRDVALAHIKAAFSSQSNGRRFVLYNKTLTFLEMASILSKEFPSYNVSQTSAPYALVWIASFFHSGAAAVLPGWGRRTVYDNQPSKEILGIQYRPIEQTVCDAGHSLIYHGFIPRNPGYAPPKPDWTPLNSERSH